MAEPSEEHSTSTCEHCGQLIDTSAVPPLSVIRCPDCDHSQFVNTHFHHFQLEEILGSGGMGTVYRAHDESLDRTVALKLLRVEHMTDRSMVAQFEREAAITASINHPHVVKIFSSGMDRGTLYMVMELVDKGSLDDLMNLQVRIAEAQVLDIGIQIAQGLQAAWRNGLLHRDVKPGNMLFTDANTVKMVDFGLAALADESAHIGGEVWGTPYYVAPEKLESPPQEDFRSDIYSLGSALFHAIAGRPPYEAEDASIVVLKVLKSQPVNLQSFAPDVSNKTAFVINRMLRKNPGERYQSYDELIEHLEYARRELQEGTPVPFAHPVAKKRSGFLPIAASVLLLGGGAWYLATHPPAPPKASVPPATPAPVYAADAEERSAAARQLLVALELPKAIDAFRALDREDVAPTLRSWNALQRALAEVLAGQPADAATTLKPFTDPAAPNSSDPLAPIFHDTATLLVSATPPPATRAAEWSPTTHEAFSLLAGGVKHWLAGDVAAALPFFTRFQSAAAADDLAWMAELQPLAATYLADQAGFDRAQTAARVAGSDAAKKKAALEVTREVRGQLRHRSPLADQLATLETQLATELAAQEAEMARQMAALDQADAELLKESRAKIDEHCRQLQFAEASTLADGILLRGTGNVPALDLIKRRLIWLTAFKAAFFNDLRTLNYRSIVQTVTATPPIVGLWQPRDTEVNVLTEKGSVATPWSNVRPESIITAAGATIRPSLTPEQIADRRWGLGLYLLAWRRNAEARPLLAQAATARPEYQEALPLLGLPAQ